MKIAAAIGGFLFLTACTNKKELEKQQQINDSLTTVVYQLKNKPSYLRIDTVFLPAPGRRVDTVFLEAAPIISEAPCLVEKYKLERVKYYLAIVDRNPSQLKFLRSWIRRAIE